MILSLLVATAVAAPASWNLPGWVRALTMTHFHLFAVGWITQIIFGVALWLFPKWSKESPRGPAWLGWACFAAINAGLAARAISETAIAMGHGGGLFVWTMTIAALLQWIAAVLFAVLIWPRVRRK